MFEKEIDELKLNYEDALNKRSDGDYKGAIEALYKALEVNSQDLNVLIQLAEVFTILNDFERAIKYYSSALEVEPENLSILSAIFNVSYKAGLYKDALKYAQKAFVINKSDKTYSHLIDVIDKFGDIKSLRNLLGNNDLSPNIMFNIAVVFIRHGFCADAEALLTRMPDGDFKTSCEALIAFNKGENDKAKSLLSNINIENDEIYNLKGLFCIDDLKLTDAIKYFNIAINLRSDEPKYYFNLANAYFYNGWFKEAEAAYRKALGMDLENIDYRFALANMYYEISDFTKAKQEIENILKIEPEHLNTKVLNALLKFKNKDYLGAKSDFENIIKYVQNNDFINLSYAEILVELSDFSKAEELVLNVLSHDKNNLHAMTVFAKLLLKQERLNEALELVNSILDKNGYYMDAFLVGMQTAYELKDFVVLKNYASEAVSIDTNYAPAYYYLALVNENQNDLEEAIECMKRAILSDLNNAEYYIKMAKLYEKCKDFKSALEYVSEAVAIDSDNAEYMLYFSELAKKNRNICQKK